MVAAGFEPAASRMSCERSCRTELHDQGPNCGADDSRSFVLPEAGVTGFEPAHAGSGDRCPSSWATPLFNLVRKGGLEPPVAEAMRFSSARVIQLHHFRTNKPGGSRTHGLLVKSQLLLPLSYGPAIDR